MTSATPLRDRLIAAGVELLEHPDQGDVTLRAITRLAGVSHGAPRRYFPTHNALLAAIAAVGISDLDALVRPLLASPGDPATVISRIAAAYVEFARDRPAMFGLMFRHDLLDGAGSNLRSTSIPLFGAIAELVQDAGIALQIWTHVHGIAVLSSHRSLELVSPRVDLDSLVTVAVAHHLDPGNR